MLQVLNRKFILSLALLCLMGFTGNAQSKHLFEIKDGNFMFDHKPMQILSGEMHYARIPHQYWHRRLKMLKAMGLNTVATYVFWNAHETEPGKWNFEGDRKSTRLNSSHAH